MMTGICKTIGILMKEVIIESMIFPVKEKKNKNGGHNKNINKYTILQLSRIQRYIMTS